MKALGSMLSNNQFSVRATKYHKRGSGPVVLCRNNLQGGLWVHWKVALAEERYTEEAAMTDTLPSVRYVPNSATL